MTPTVLTGLDLVNVHKDYAIVYRVNLKGQPERCGKVGMLEFGADDDLIDDHISGTWGPGTYKLDYRQNDKRGTVETRTIIIADPKPRENPGIFPRYGDPQPPPPLAAAPLPAAPPVDQSLITGMFTMLQAVLVAVIGNMSKDHLSPKDLIALATSGKDRTPVSELAEVLKFSQQFSNGGGSGGGDDATTNLLASVASKVVDHVMAPRGPALPVAPAPSIRSFANAPLPLPAALPLTTAAPLIESSAPAPVAHAQAPDVPSLAATGPGADDDVLAGVDLAEVNANTVLFAQLLKATARSSERDPHSYAETLIDMIGLDSAEYVAGMDNLSIINQFTAHFQELLPQAEFIAQVADALRSMFVDPTAAPSPAPASTASAPASVLRGLPATSVDGRASGNTPR